MSNARGELKNSGESQSALQEPIAIVGMDVDLPGAPDVPTFWDNLRNGVESIEPLDEEALLAAGESPDRIHHKNYVAAAARMNAFDEFDAEFFGFSAKEAAILDPQHRKFMEVSWGALENAGHMPENFDGPIGVYAGCGMGSYFYFNICSNPELVDDVGMFLLRHTGNDKDFLSTRISHILDLKGPSINIQTACSTSLVAVHYACEALRRGDCDMALAGGVTIELPHGRGYLFKENEILSPDGHCHAFDHRAQGTVFGSGAGCVALRRLSEAQADGDHIYAIIRGSAVNNDGADKASYLAPSVDGQAAAISQALDAAQVTADTLDYVECHGTGTYLGDPIEVSALTEAYRRTTEETGYCRIGSVKTNIGHLDTAAGVASLVKASMGLYNRQMPPSLGYEAPNPAIDFETSPFAVNNTLRDWDGRGTPRRAGVNSLGVGGTNVHAILEEAPDRSASEESDWPFHILCLSARSKSALEANTAALAEHLRQHPEQPLADIAWSLKQGRRGFDKRRVVVAETHEEATALLEAGDTRRVFTHDHLGDAPKTVFMFPGGGAQYTDMGRDLYETEPVFAEWMDRGLDHLQAQLDYDIRALWLPEEADRVAAEETLKQPSVQLPLIMIVEFALAQLWISWGVKPTALVGHSMGENTAAALAGVMRFEDCIDLVLLRGRLFDTVPKGGMLSVSLPVERLEDMIGDDLDIASVNAPELSAVSGADEKLDALAKRLDAEEIEYQRIAIDIAAHSRMLDPILGHFRKFLDGLSLSAPTLPILSNRTGEVLTDAQATDPDYWVQQLRNRVEFGACVSKLAETQGRVYLEVGPGKALSSLAQMCPALKPGQVISSLRHPEQDIADDAYFLSVIGRLWACGVEADWAQIWGDARRNRVPLHRYAFQRKRYFIEPGKAAQADTAPSALMRNDDISEWGYQPVWRPQFANSSFAADHDLSRVAHHTWLIFMDEAGLASVVASRLEDAGHPVARVWPGDMTARTEEHSYTLAAEMGRDAYETLFELLAEAEMLPSRIAHFWGVTERETFRPGSNFFARNLEMGFYSLMHLGQSLGHADADHPVHIDVFTNGAEQVKDEPLPYPEKALIAGPAGVIPHELPGVTCTTIDLTLPQAPIRKLFSRKADADFLEPLASRVLEDMLAEPGNVQAVYRGEKRFEKVHEPVALADTDMPAFRDGGTYLITGGFGGIGLTLATQLAKAHNANVALLSRDKLPDPSEWDSYLETHGRANRVARRIQHMRAIKAAGGHVAAFKGDVCNAQDMARVAGEIEARFGKLTGVIHAAGTVNDAPLLAKDASEVDTVFGPKVTGLRILDELYPDGTLELMVLFASSSTITRPAGQVDYVAANEYLNAFAKSRKSAKTRVIAINWGVWAEVGMAADAMAQRMGETDAEEWRKIDQPLLDQGQIVDDAQIFQTDFSAAQHWVIDGHRTAKGDALMPGTGYIELAAEAMAAKGDGVPFQIRDMHFLRAMDVPDGQGRTTQLHLSREGDMEVRSTVDIDGRTGTVLNVQAQLLPLETEERRINAQAIKARCTMRETATLESRILAPQETHLKFGPRWHVLRETARGDAEGLAHLRLPDACRADIDAGFLMHPGLLDPATGWAMHLIPGYRGGHLWVPLGYQTIDILRPLPAEVLSWVRLSDHGDGYASFDVTLADPTGDVCVEITGFQMQRLEDQSAFGKPAPIIASEVQFDDADTVAPLSPDEERLQHNISQGIRPADGPEALRRAMALGLPQVTISSLDLNGLKAQADAATAIDTSDGQSFERPDLDGDYLAPRTETEERLAAHWEKLLGVSPIGVDDSFFDLGGHSLIAVRLFATIKKEWGTQFPISVLFDAPTIAKIAEQIDERTGGASSTTEPSADDADAPARKQGFTHLVALNRGDANRAPLFIVAGMFGNVLNLRHLAQQLGPDQPVYGLQARGLMGDDEPHVTVSAAASDYIAEIRQVQPQGPYLLGGFSGGGITAYEMAQQIEAEGDQVALLAMLDTPLPVRPFLSKRDKALIKLAELKRKGPAYFKEWALNRLEWELQKRKPQGDSGQGFNNHKIEMAFRQAVGQYELTPWDGNMLLYRPPLDRHWAVSHGNWVSAEREYVFDDNQWTQWVPGVQVIEVPGDHDSMVLDPNVAVLARHLSDEIASLSKRDGSQPAPVKGSTITAAE